MLPNDDEDSRDPQHLLIPSSSQQHYIPHSDQDLIKPLDHSSSALANKWKEKVHKAFQLLFKDLAAKEKSMEQLNVIVSMMTIQLDILITLKTGGGKSALWMIAPLIDAKNAALQGFVKNHVAQGGERLTQRGLASACMLCPLPNLEDFRRLATLLENARGLPEERGKRPEECGRVPEECRKCSGEFPPQGNTSTGNRMEG
ncbi:uncharacterized protein BJ212DRAFT_1484733 [Suillus subaureus]|uniref:Uncharacterized protein n=1 Tax=Suillus subaureus TaxID=48587 RepID=A0A9P7E1W3_9AGAM|nr:uncharacterized protein BJ212DRAFT_1484733 [Suillus subaureus]KAG1808875.1 hypothetical protein BJ212DRAFT_1484733 [Suillus subaureus]